MREGGREGGKEGRKEGRKEERKKERRKKKTKMSKLGFHRFQVRHFSTRTISSNLLATVRWGNAREQI